MFGPARIFLSTSQGCPTACPDPFARRGRRLAELDELFQGRAKTRYSTYEALDEETDVADVVVGAVLIPAPRPRNSSPVKC